MQIEHNERARRQGGGLEVTNHACLSNLLKLALGHEAASHQRLRRRLQSRFHCQEAAHLHGTVSDKPTVHTLCDPSPEHRQDRNQVNALAKK